MYKNSIDFFPARRRTTQMLTCFNPKHLVTTACFLAAATVYGAAPQPGRGAADASGAAPGNSPAPASSSYSATTDLSVIGFNFNAPLQDSYSKGSWMVAEVDFTGKAAGNAKWLDDVEVVLTIGWGTTGAHAQIDLALTSTVHLLSVEAGKRDAVFFFVPPEVLNHGPKNTTFAANTPPTFYAVQFKLGGSPVSSEYRKSEVSDKSLPNKEYVDAFVGKAETGKLMSEATVPSYVLFSLLSGNRLNGNVFPTFLQNSDSGH